MFGLGCQWQHKDATNITPRFQMAVMKECGGEGGGEGACTGVRACENVRARRIEMETSYV